MLNTKKVIQNAINEIINANALRLSTKMDLQALNDKHINTIITMVETPKDSCIHLELNELVSALYTKLLNA